MRTDHPFGNPQDLAACYAAGAMSAAEAAEFEAHLAGGCTPCGSELHVLLPAAAELLAAAPPRPPAPAVREAILRRAAASVQTQPWKAWSSSVAAGRVVVVPAAADGPWEETGTPGVRVRPLFVDRAANRMTALFRMAPGTRYPRHLHRGVEECWVLEGDLAAEDFAMRAGDYQRAYAGSEHGDQWTVGGCLLLISSSLGDELLPA